MTHIASRRLFGSLIALFILACFAQRAAADLVWDPQTGWRIEGGVLAGVVGSEDERNALTLMNKARKAEEDGSNRKAIKTYNKVAKNYSNSVYAPEALYRSSKLYLARKQYYKSFETIQSLLARYPNYTRFNELIGEQYRIATALQDGARNRILGLVPGFKNRDKAVTYFEIILINAPYSDYAPLSLMNLARVQEKMNRDDEAIDALDRLINNYPQSLLAPDAYLQLAQIHASLVEGPYYDQGSTEQSITYYQDFMILFPNDPGVAAADVGLTNMKSVLARSKMLLGDFYFFKRDNYRAARVFYNEAITVFPDSSVAELAHKRLEQVDKEEAEAKAKNTDGAKKKHFLFF